MAVKGLQTPVCSPGKGPAIRVFALFFLDKSCTLKMEREVSCPPPHVSSHSQRYRLKTRWSDLIPKAQLVERNYGYKTTNNYDDNHNSNNIFSTTSSSSSFVVFILIVIVVSMPPCRHHHHHHHQISMLGIRSAWFGLKICVIQQNFVVSLLEDILQLGCLHKVTDNGTRTKWHLEF